MSRALADELDGLARSPSLIEAPPIYFLARSMNVAINDMVSTFARKPRPFATSVAITSTD